ncbi:SDR family NAD(P)-dependent oxidoreductase [Maribellus sp. CM-23]|uniref:SDR family NAD(P)-dependent oxidoreductase n=1 Tax=Maribellus sp. CM-23 TaxID=2781026 RepID=UPI001F21CC02|nr:SDR family NAD(P)-dependent oxidoreductase [Maribellus sp. CM-23]MCE4564278.1 SDR family NAD(P)-dependent oxidoreductase [Maribellus sp. CM-23]
MDFSGKTIWVTGATSGIGKEVALALSKEKCTLILSGRNEAALEEVASLCNSNGSTAYPVSFDLGNIPTIEAACQKVNAKGLVPDALYHFGGISQRALVSETPLQVDRKIFEVNYFGTIALTKLVLPGMIAKGDGHIAATSSIVGKFGFPYRSSYSASKQALHGFFESLLAENKQNNIRVSMIIPGFISTNISVNAVNSSGEAHGKLDENQAGGMPADQCAKIICKGLKREKKEILVGNKEIIMVYIRRFLPRLYYYLASRVKPM